MRNRKTAFTLIEPFDRLKARSFTLIELLVVIAIIAILASMLMPSLGKARAVGKGAVCRSNIRQMALGMSGYMADTGGWLPGGLYGAPDAGQTTYYLETMRQIGADLAAFPDSLTIWNDLVAGTGKWMKIAKIQLCPEDTAWGSYAPYGSYGMNAPGWDFYAKSGGVFNGRVAGVFVPALFDFSRVRQPSGTVMLSEMLHHGSMPAIDGNYQTANVWDPIYAAGDANGPWLDARHFHAGGGRAVANSGGYIWEGTNNYVFFDGHVEGRLLPPYTFGNPIPVGSNLPTYSSLVQ